MMILIYSPRISNRLQYAIQFIFEDFCRIEYKFSSDIQYFKNFQGPKINYSEERVTDGEFFIKANGLLEREGIVPIEIPVKKDSDTIKIFYDSESDGNFDVFSAIFYLVSRYEEYLPFKKDKHGRFEADQSFTYQHGFLDRPIVDEWIISLQEQLTKKFSSLKWKSKEYNFIPTLDIDQAFTIQEKSFWRFTKTFFSAIVNLKIARLYYILKVRFGLEKDPFDQFENIEKLHKKYNLSAIYFFLFSKKYNRFDVNISIKNKAFRKRIKEVAKTAAIGIHPSYHSRYDFKLIEEEIQLLSNVLNLPINSSRQHFLKMRLPNTYKSLLSLGISHEYTMGYATMPGFRAGTTQSFRFYDIKHEQLTFLRVHPFCVMDATFKTYLNYTEEQAFECIKDLIAKVKKVNGNFIPLWHNESISGYREWAGWENLYEKMLIEGTNHPSLNIDNSSFIIHHS